MSKRCFSDLQPTTPGLAAARRGLETFVLTNAIRGVDAQPGDSACAVEEMKAASVKLVTVEELV